MVNIEEQEEGIWTKVVWNGRGGPNTSNRGRIQHFQELSFHAERKFFKVLRHQGRISVSEVTTQREFQVHVNKDEVFWLARTCKHVGETGADAQRKGSRRNGVTLIVDLLNNDRGRVLKIWKSDKKSSQSLIFPEGGNGRSWTEWLSIINAICVDINTARDSQPREMESG
ncbi:hypothetical protein Sjap_015097 [Stephania japonica]|uniref:Uncharacterized protein n=1 Tax=Stephania japonica TaxID=461633 RepID=A0AAP0IIY4_9MAGN